MLRPLCLAAWALLVALPGAVVAQTTHATTVSEETASIPEIPFHRYTLKNGGRQHTPSVTR